MVYFCGTGCRTRTSTTRWRTRSERREHRASQTCYRISSPCASALDGVDYLADDGTVMALFCASRLGQPVLIEGEPGVGKTEAAKALAAALQTPLVRLQCYEGIDVAEALYEWNYPRQLLAIRLAEARGDRAGRGCAVQQRVLDRATAAHRAASPRPSAGGAAYRRGRSCRRRLRGVPAGVARRGRGHHSGARHGPCHASTNRRVDVEPDAGTARRAQAPLPLPLDRIPVGGAGSRDRPAARAGQLANAR